MNGRHIRVLFLHHILSTVVTRLGNGRKQVTDAPLAAETVAPPIRRRSWRRARVAHFRILWSIDFVFPGDNHRKSIAFGSPIFTSITFSVRRFREFRRVLIIIIVAFANFAVF